MCLVKEMQTGPVVLNTQCVLPFVVTVLIMVSNVWIHVRRSSHTSHLEIGTVVATLSGAWQYRVCARTGWPRSWHNNNHIQRRYSRFFTISSQCRKLTPTRTLKWPRCNRVQITCNTSSAYHVQMSCYVPLGTKGQLSC